jgi:hypothetical protein
MRFTCFIVLCLLAGCQPSSPLGHREQRAQADIEAALRRQSPAGWEWLTFHSGQRSVVRQENASPAFGPPDHFVIYDGAIVRINGSNINAIYLAVIAPDGRLTRLRFIITGEDWREVALPEPAK